MAWNPGCGGFDLEVVAKRRGSGATAAPIRGSGGSGVRKIARAEGSVFGTGKRIEEVWGEQNRGGVGVSGGGGSQVTRVRVSWL